MCVQNLFSLSFFLMVIVTIAMTATSKNAPISEWKTSSGFHESQTHTWDFDFDDRREHEEPVVGVGPEKSLMTASQVWAENDLCKNLQCKPHQVCLVEDDDVAVCVSRRKLKVKENIDKSAVYNKREKSIEDESKEEEIFWEKGEQPEKSSLEQDSQNPCIPCPVVKPEFVCGSDNHTYSSVCRLEFRNCMHKASVTASCKGFCPCKVIKNEIDRSKEKQMKERWNRYMNKYHSTVTKQSAGHKSVKPASKPNSRGNENVPLQANRDILATSEETMHQPAQNSVLHNAKTVTPIIEKGCSDDELKAMGDRLLDWFSVVMTDHRRGQSRRRSFRLSHTQLPDCKPEVSWMFQHLDTDGDMKLSLQELYDLENDDREHCLRPYLLDCDVDRDLVLSPYEWCSCFDKSQRPCAAALRRTPQGLIGGYVPQCDGDGYYLPTQCHSGSGTCWCVDRHGVEFTNTRRRGRPDCEGLLRRGQYHHELARDDDQEDDSNEEEEGSADRPLDF
uniref:U53-Liphistoxin-Lsp1a_1 n=1 Tax=Liphistius sp. SGP-2016 TaxID=1905180 RepID=A0A4Q8K3Q4_9ARAC